MRQNDPRNKLPRAWVIRNRTLLGGNDFGYYCSFVPNGGQHAQGSGQTCLLNRQFRTPTPTPHNLLNPFSVHFLRRSGFAKCWAFGPFFLHFGRKSQGQKRYPKELLRQTIRRAFGWTSGCVRCANAQPFLCNELGPFQAILGNFQATLGNLLWPFSGDFRQFQAIFRLFQAISGNLGNFLGAETQEKNQFWLTKKRLRIAHLSGVICLKTLVLLGSALELFTKFFGAVRAIFLALTTQAVLQGVPFAGVRVLSRKGSFCCMKKKVRMKKKRVRRTAKIK